MAKKPKKQLALPKGTAAFSWIHKRDSGHKYSNDKFKTTIVWDEDVDLSKVEDACQELAQQEWGEDVDLDEVRRPYKLAEDQTKEDFEGKVTLNASSKYKPKALDAKKKKLPKSVRIMSGDLIKIVVTLVPYESTEKVKEGKKMVTVTTQGISAQLSVAQLLEKRSGGGGENLLDEEEGFDGSEYDDEDDDEEEDDEDDDEDGDF